MRHLPYLLLALICTSNALHGQNTLIPQLVSFSAVVRDQNNNVIAHTPVNLRLTVRQGGSGGAAIYCELQQDQTNINGFISVQLNRNVLAVGCNGAPSAPFDLIPWHEGDMWLEVEYQTLPGTVFISLGSLEIASSFYAFAAGTAERLQGFNTQGAQHGDVLAYDQGSGQWGPMPGGGGFSGDYNDLSNLPQIPAATSQLINDSGFVTNADDADADPENEIQELTVSFIGDTLRLTKSNYVIVPGISAANYLFIPGEGVTDIDGNFYNSVILANGQEWMQDNLRVTRYANGDPIPNVSGASQWAALTTGAWCHYENYADFDVPRGKIYNWYAAADPRNACPSGWHVPTDSEWFSFENHIDPSVNDPIEVFARGTDAGAKMRAFGTLQAGTGLWEAPYTGAVNTGATNASGFTAVPTGFRDPEGVFYDQNITAYWWNATESSPTHGWYRTVGYDYQKVGKNQGDKPAGIAIRCLKD